MTGLANLRELGAAAILTPTVLIVDGNLVSRRFVELALTKDGAFVVETANDASSALEILNAVVVDLVISDTDLADMNGLHFFRRLSQESRLRSLPFVFLSADRRVETKVAALRAGVDDYLLKPCDAAEFAARASSLVSRQTRARERFRERTYSLAGDFSVVGFPELVSLVEMGRRSGVLAIVNDHAGGQIVFDHGRVVHATYGNVSGENAFYMFVGEPEGHFEFSPGPCELPPEARTIDMSATALIMEGARIFDTANAGVPQKLAPRPVSSIPTHRRMATTTAPPQRLPACALDTTLAAQIELGLRDGFSLGEMRVWSEAELAKWTAHTVGRDRFHVVLIANLPVGVSSILALASAPTERWVVESLSETRKAFGLAFFLRHERAVDVVLIDAAAPDAFQDALLRVPSAVIIAPTGGDFLSFGTRARVALERMLRDLAPKAIVGVGNAALGPALADLDSVQNGSAVVRCAQGVLGEGGCDLRALLIKAVRLAASRNDAGYDPRGARG